MKWKTDRGLVARQLNAWTILLGLFTGMVIALAFIFTMFGMTGTYFYLTMIAISLGFALIQFFISDKLVLWTTGSKIVSEEEEPELYAMVRKLSSDAGVPMPKVAVMRSPVPNAFATGRSPRHSVVAVTTSIRNMLTRQELEAVLAHEITHIKCRDVLTMTIGSFIVMIAAAVMSRAWVIYHLSNNSNDDSAKSGILLALGLIAVSFVVRVVGTLVTLAISRYREFSADRGSAYITRNPDALIRALTKITDGVQATPADSKRQISGANSFFIIPAISGESILELFSTHPSLEKRIANLEKVKDEMNRGYY
ncbi:MAG TPA: zinc metalloprotease HtpX [Methanocorpusculum sp.]|nr:zinc metalloprotease HtpX [Methanocorpusculum sp.]